MTLKIGIDDAGRGPVIGPMVLAGVLIEEEDEECLKNLGVKDSKLLISKKREEIAEKILDKFRVHIEQATVEEIDSRQKIGTDLNRIEALKAAKIIKNLTKDINSDDKIKVIIDCPSPNITTWKAQVEIHLENPKILDISCEHKADLNHLIVGAASIIAKQTREEEMEKIKKQIEIDCGSGYPADPKTKEFLEKYGEEFEKSGIIRTTWDTWEKFKAKKEQRNLF